MATSRPATLADVAKEAGVSLATASRAFNGSTRVVGSDLVARVQEAAARLRYSPNVQAQAVVRGHTNTVGLLVTDIADPYFSTIAAGVTRAATAHDMVPLLGTTDGRADGWISHLATMRGHRAAAAILVGSRHGGADEQESLANAITNFEADGGRVVVVSQAGLPADTLVVQNRRGARELATALAGRGYRNFGILSGPPELLTASDRTRGFREGVRAQRLPDPVTVPGDFTRDGGYAAMSTLLDQGSSIDCVFACNDVMAVGALTACRDRGVRVPEDLALAGFDDIPTLRDIHPSLTTVTLPLQSMGEAAIELVLDRDADAPRRRMIRGDVVLRDSTPQKR